MNTIIVNGIVIQTDAKNISVVNGKVIVDGKTIDVDENEKNISIVVQGDIESIQADKLQYIEVSGNVKKDVKTQSGDVRCGEVGGSVSASSGNVSVEGSVGASVSTQSGDIDCGGDIKGDVRSASGDISARGKITGRCSTLSGDISGGY